MRENERIQLEKNLYIIGLCLPWIGAAVCLLYGRLPEGLAAKIMAPCMFHTITGFYCPGCGGSRAVAALVRGEILLSFLYHPIVMYCAVIYLWFMGSHIIERFIKHKRRTGMRYRNCYLWIALGIVALHTAVKNIALAVFHVDILRILDAL
ncbi:MAG: DUF2752 domain-containing protein [Lachnospiraceae bacterium]|nr:DUF2752 domain-containing protein [Lachnospiraceae bacterium]